MKKLSVSDIPAAPDGSYPWRLGNFVRPLIDGGAAFGRIEEAVDAAQVSVWVTVAFLSPAFELPGSGRSFLNLLDDTTERGLDVRVLFWRHNPETTRYEPSSFPGSTPNMQTLSRRGSRFRARWDRAQGPDCQHQKSWLIDAGEPSETAFVGGMNLNPEAVALPGHQGANEFHDLYAEIQGPAATDVHHNFVQRWNEASERNIHTGAWGHTGDDDLAFPQRVSPSRGDSALQMQRTIGPSLYLDGHATPGGDSYDIGSGEHSIRTQYSQAIRAAKRSIYVENQSLLSYEIVSVLHEALRRGVEVIMVVPMRGERRVKAARQRAEHHRLFDLLAQLDRYPNFTLAGISTRGSDGVRHNVHVHSKAMLVDDEWSTIGSCNLRDRSLETYTELNVAIWDRRVVLDLRRRLFAEHIGYDTTDLDDSLAYDLFRQVAESNRTRSINDPAWQGLVRRLDPNTYGTR